MASIPDKIRSKIIGQTVNLTRYEASLQADVLAMLDELGADLIKGLMGAGLDTPRTDWQRARLQAMLKEAKATINAALGDIGDWHSDQMSGLVQVSGRGISTAMNEAIGANLMVPPKWTKEQLRAIASDVLIDGAPSATWWDRQASDLMNDFSDSMRKGMMRGESITELRNRIMGQDIRGVGAVGKVDLRTVPVLDRAVIKTARRNAEALVRTSVITVNNSAHMAAYEANSDIMAGVTWCATLDPRSCMSCASLDGKTWTMDESHPVPSLHWNCRCFLLPETKSFQQLAKEAHGNSSIAKQLDEIEPGNRASIGGPVSGNLKYEDWLMSQSDTRQESILGKGRFDLFKRGKIGFTDLVSQKGNPLTLKELEAAFG